MKKKYKFNERPMTRIEFETPDILQQIASRPFSCLIGPNNSGKSYLLKNLVAQVGENATYLGPARYNNFNALSPYSPQPNKRSKWYQNFIKQLRESNQNLDNSPFNIQQAIAELDDQKRQHLFEIAEAILGSTLSLELAYPENQMSQRYISCNGHNFSYASSGTRLVISIVTSLLDTTHTHFLIDEPELGVSPKSQGQLADFIFDKRNRKKYFPHVSSLVFATHSSIFLDRRDISNNFIVAKEGDVIKVSRINSLSDFNQIHFFLLGNRLESLFLPSLILFVEGPTEEAFLRRIIQLRHPNIGVSIVNATNDSEMKRYAHMISQVFPHLSRSPYGNRIFPILDSIHGAGILDVLRQKGIDNSQVIVWSQNGIEHYYPESILREISGGFGELSITGDEVTMCGTTLRKTELCDRVVGLLEANTPLHEELEEKLLSRIDALV